MSSSSSDDAQRVQEIRARLEAATPGPYGDTAIGRHAADADFIGHAREDVPYLLARLDALTAEQKAITLLLNEYRAAAGAALHPSMDGSHLDGLRRLQSKTAEMVQAERDALAARLAAAEAALKGVCGKLGQPGEEFFSEHTDKGWRGFLLTHRREIGRPLNSRDSVLARMAYLSGFMGGAQSGAYLLYVHHLTRAGSREQATGEGRDASGE